MASRNWAWVVLKREGVEEDEVATQVFCPEGRSFNVDALKDAAKAKFGQGLAHVDASQLSVSATRGGDTADPRTLVSTIAPNADSTLYIHAPAPPQAPAASTGTEGLVEALNRLETRLTAMETPPQGASPRPRGSGALVSVRMWWPGGPCAACWCSCVTPAPWQGRARIGVVVGVL